MREKGWEERAPKAHSKTLTFLLVPYDLGTLEWPSKNAGVFEV